MSEFALTRVVELHGPSAHVIDPSCGMRVKVLHGDVWLTAQGDQRDHFLASGDEVAFDARRRTVIESFGPAWIEIDAPLQRGLLRRVREALGRWCGSDAGSAQTLNRKCITSPSRTT